MSEKCRPTAEYFITITLKGDTKSSGNTYEVGAVDTPAYPDFNSPTLTFKAPRDPRLSTSVYTTVIKVTSTPPFPPPPAPKPPLLSCHPSSLHYSLPSPPAARYRERGCRSLSSSFKTQQGQLVKRHENSCSIPPPAQNTYREYNHALKTSRPTGTSSSGHSYTRTRGTARGHASQRTRRRVTALLASILERR